MVHFRLQDASDDVALDEAVATKVHRFELKRARRGVVLLQLEFAGLRSVRKLSVDYGARGIGNQFFCLPDGALLIRVQCQFGSHAGQRGRKSGGSEVGAAEISADERRRRRDRLRHLRHSAGKQHKGRKTAN